MDVATAEPCRMVAESCVRRNDLYNFRASAIIVSLRDHLERVTAEGDTVFLRDNSPCVTA